MEFVTRRLIANGAVMEPSPELASRIDWAAKWARAVKLRASETGGAADKPEQELPSLDPKTVSALRNFASAVAASKTPEEAQAAAFDSVKQSGAESGKFFTAVYRILVGADRGPRLGPYVMDAGPEKVAQKIIAALDAARYN